MLTYLEKFNNLPKEIRDRMHSPEVISVINELEDKHGTRLASVVMKIVVGEVLVSELDTYLVREFALGEKKAKELVLEMREKILDKVVKKNETAVAPVNETHLIKYEKSEPGKSEVNPPTPPTPLIKGAQESVIKADEPLVVKGSNFFFSPDDEEEIRDLVKKISVPEISSQESVKDKVAKVFDELQINFGSEFLSDRFKKIIETYIKGIRNKMETKATLQKPFEQGGLSFDEESVVKILDTMDKYKAGDGGVKVGQPKKISVPEDSNLASLRNSGMRDVGYDFGALAAKKQENNQTVKQSNSQIKDQESKEAVKQEGRGGLKNRDAVKQEDVVGEDKNLKKQDNSGISVPPIRFSEAPGKIKMHDIRVPRPNIMTPVDELKYLDLVNFRRLSRESLLKAKDKIREKIRLLGAESYDKRIEGIKAWRISPINKLYLQIGEESISKNEPIDVIIEERKARGDEYLTNPELEAVMDLNKEFRF